MNTRKINVLIVSMFLLLLFGCKTDNDILLNSIIWENDGNGFIQFKTNDPSYCGYYYHSPQIIDLSSEEIVGKKMSGAIGYGYGVYFKYSDSNNYYRFQIKPIGKYSVSKRVDGTIYSILGSTDSLLINTDYGEENTIKIENIGSDYNIYLNGSFLDHFNDSDHSTGTSNYCISIGIESNEDFPSVPADFRLKKQLF